MTTLATGRQARDAGKVEHAMPAAPTRRRRRWLLALPLTLVVVWFAPPIVAHSPLLRFALAWIASLAEIDGSIHAERASLGWFQPVTLADVEVHDASGKPIARAVTAGTEKTFLQLLCRPTELGRVRVEKASLDLVLREDGSNVEDLLASWLAADGETSAAVSCEIELVDGRMTVHDAAAQRRWQMDGVSLALQFPGGWEGCELSLSAAVADPAGTGDFKMKLRIPAAAPAAGELLLEAKSLPLGLGRALLDRLAPGSRLAGHLNGTLACGWQATGASWQLKGELRADNLVLGGPWLGTDTLRLAQLSVPCDMVWQNGRLRVNQFEVRSEVGQLACRGQMEAPAALLWTGGGKHLLDALASATGQAAARLDMARLASQIPSTLRIREAMQITSGELAFDLAATGAADGRVWQGRLDANKLAAVDHGREVVWEQPITVTCDARRDAAGRFSLDRLYCASDFLELEGSGTADYFTVSASHDLGALASRLGRFVNLGGLRLAGDGSTWLSWKRESDGTFEGDAQIDIEKLEVASPGKTPWLEEHLAITAETTGWIGKAGSGRVESAEFLLASAADRLSVRLVEPVAAEWLEATWPLQVLLLGDLSRWTRRLSPWVEQLEGWQLAGQAELAANIRCSRQRVRLEPLELAIRSFRLWGRGFFIDEPLLRLDAAADCDFEAGRLHVGRLAFETSALNARMDQAAMAWNESTAELAGKAAIEGDIERLSRWVRDPLVESTWHLEGRYRGQLEVSRQRQALSASLEGLIDGLKATSAGGGGWSEPQVRVAMKSSYDPETDRMELGALQIESRVAQLDAQGRLDHLSGSREVEVAGEVGLDLAQLERMLQPYVGGKLRLAGRETHRFALSGPLAAPDGKGQTTLAELQGSGSLGWQSIAAYGFAAGPGRLDARLASGVIRGAPLDLALSEGRLRLAPEVRIAPGPAELVLGPGKLAEQVRITPEMCNAGLMYIVPVLAGVPQVEGRVSLVLQGARIPLADAQRGEAAGRLVVHSVDVGPGVLVQQLAPIVQALAQLVTGDTAAISPLGRASLRPESEVTFRLVDGRVYHRGVELLFSDVIVRTYGSVGLDRSLALMVEVPIPDKWLSEGPLGAALRGQALRLPISGSMDHLAIDYSELTRLRASVLRGTAEGLLRGAIDHQLDKLLGNGAERRAERREPAEAGSQ